MSSGYQMSVHLRKQASALHSRLITLSLHVSATALLIFLAAAAGAGVVSADFFISALLRLLYRRIILIGKHLLRRFLLLYLCLDTHAVKNLQRILLNMIAHFLEHIIRKEAMPQLRKVQLSASWKEEKPSSFHVSCVILWV